MRRLALLPLLALGLAAPAAAQHEHAGHAAPSAAAPGLAAQLDEVRRTTARYRDHAAAAADGFRRFGAEGPLMGEHWYQPDRVRAPLDLARPSTLQYATIGGERVLVGVAYTVYQRPDEPLPEGFAGSGDHWHAHDVEAMARVLVEDRPLLRWIVNRRADRGKLGAGDGRTRLTMVHAWVWSENPAGVFAQEHRALPYLRAGLPAAWASTADSAAASGVALLAPEACLDEERRISRLLRLADPARRDLRESCARAAARVRAALGTGPETLNAAAAAAWTEHAATRASLLTAPQRARLAALERATTMH